MIRFISTIILVVLFGNLLHSQRVSIRTKQPLLFANLRYELMVKLADKHKLGLSAMLTQKGQRSKVRYNIGRDTEFVSTFYGGFSTQIWHKSFETNLTYRFCIWESKISSLWLRFDPGLDFYFRQNFSIYFFRKEHGVKYANGTITSNIFFAGSYKEQIDRSIEAERVRLFASTGFDFLIRTRFDWLSFSLSSQLAYYSRFLKEQPSLVYDGNIIAGRLDFGVNINLGNDE